MITGSYAKVVGRTPCVHHHTDDVSSRANYCYLHSDQRLGERRLAHLAILVKKGGVVNEGEQNFETLFTSLIVLFSCFKFYLQCFILKLSILQLKTQCTSLLQYCVPWFLQPFLDAFNYLLFFALVSLMHQMLVGHATNFCTAFNCLRVQMIIYQLNVHCGHFLMTISI